MARLLSLLLLFLAAPALALSPGELDSFARAHGIKDVSAFVDTVSELRSAGRLPPRYLTKTEAQHAGWSPGRSICSVLPGRAIGGDVFKNAEGQLPQKLGRRWREADLDTSCGNNRGAKRLVFSNDGLQFVTVDHYKSFTQVPP